MTRTEEFLSVVISMINIQRQLYTPLNKVTCVVTNCHSVTIVSLGEVIGLSFLKHPPVKIQVNPSAFFHYWHCDFALLLQSAFSSKSSKMTPVNPPNPGSNCSTKRSHADTQKPFWLHATRFCWKHRTGSTTKCWMFSFLLLKVYFHSNAAGSAQSNTLTRCSQAHWSPESWGRTQSGRTSLARVF